MALTLIINESLLSVFCFQYLRGEEWYSLEATRAVNQAIGRVIRHRNDYGAILLLDTRFNNLRVKDQMSKWLRGHIKVSNNFGEVMKDVRMFFKNAEMKVKFVFFTFSEDIY